MFQVQNGLNVESLVWNRGEQLDVLEALLAHVRWKKRLLNYIEEKSEERLDPVTMRCDSACALGQWLHGVGKVIYGEKPLFVELMTLHAEFHRQAAEVVCAVDRGERDRALTLLQQGNYARTSRRLNAVLAKISLEFDF